MNARLNQPNPIDVTTRQAFPIIIQASISNLKSSSINVYILFATLIIPQVALLFPSFILRSVIGHPLSLKNLPCASSSYPSLANAPLSTATKSTQNLPLQHLDHLQHQHQRHQLHYAKFSFLHSLHQARLIQMDRPGRRAPS
jgi:hypothetical protein